MILEIVLIVIDIFEKIKLLIVLCIKSQFIRSHSEVIMVDNMVLLG